jgi:hypothetical protein
MPPDEHVGRPVDDQPWPSGDPPVDRDRHVNGSTLIVGDEPDLLGGRPQDEYRSRPGVQDRGPAQGRTGHPAGEGGVNAGRHTLPPASRKTVADGIRGEAFRLSLEAADHSPLATADVIERLSFHEPHSGGGATRRGEAAKRREAKRLARRRRGFDAADQEA